MSYFDDPKEDAALTLILYHHPQNLEGHDPACPGIKVTLHDHRDSCFTCRVWLAEALRENRRLDRVERRPH